MRIAIDFDGVVCDWEGIVRGHDFSKCVPKQDAPEAINWLLSRGDDIWIFTTRDSSEWKAIRNWLKEWGIPKLPITNIKKKATIYLDDRAIRFTNWQDFCKLLE